MSGSLSVDRKLKYDVFQINKVFSAIRQINSQMIRENDEKKLLKQACKILKDDVGYDLVYIALANHAKTHIEQVFLSEQNEPAIKPNGFYCFNEIVQMQCKQLFHPQINCFDCFFKDYFKNQERLIIPIKFQQNFYGMMSIIPPVDYKLYVKEQDLLESLAEDIAYTLFNLQVRREHAQVRHEIADYYQKIENQNEQLKEKNNQLLIANKKANESDLLKDSFLAMISHELRTPLNGILGFTQLIKSANTPVDKAGEFIEVIHQSGIQLLQVINNLLEISKIEAEQLKYNEREININALFEHVYDDNQYLIGKTDNVDFIIRNELNKTFSFLSDFEKLSGILNVLVSNALKFTPKGVVEMGCLRSGKDKLQFYVQDTGIGIEKEKSGIIFQNFRQSDESISRRYGGTGLGLSIAKGLVDFLRGEIWFESEVNLGSIFCFTIPVTITEPNKQTV
ncbi:MAG TPA: ATP-binding protein [Bacteroidales bacterium]|nr:ATP-binding protein [Bacteroidales bacterium]